jgi:hypothetical protein
VQAHDWGIPAAYDWQEAIWSALWRPGAQVSVVTCNESGKTSVVVPVAALAFAAAFPSGQVVITSASERQLKKQLEPALKNMIARRKGWRASGGTIYGPSIDGLPESSITCFATKSGELFEGFHPRWYTDDRGVLRYSPLLVIADEAKSVKNDIFTAIERCNPTCELRISTAGEDNGGFYDACTDESGLWTREWKWNGRMIAFKIPWTDCPHLLRGNTYDRKLSLLEKLGPNDPIVCSILMAEFFRGGTQMVFNDSDLMAVKAAMDGVVDRRGGRRVAFCDFSGGGDELTFGMRTGNYIHPIVAWTQDSTVPPTKTAAKYVSLFRQNGLNPDQIFGDNGGLGAQIINEIEAMGYAIHRVNNHKAAINHNSYTNRYAELHWDFKSMIHEQKLILPKDHTLYGQMRLRRFSMKNDDSNRISLEPKQHAHSDRQENSPDRLDTVVGLLIGIEDLPGLKDHQQGGAMHCPTHSEYMEGLRGRGQDGGESNFGGGWGGDSF